MKIILENEVDEAIEKEYTAFLHEEEECEHFGYAFIAGIEFVESKFEELCTEFMEWLLPRFNSLDERKRLFNQFLKERNKKE